MSIWTFRVAAGALAALAVSACKPLPEETGTQPPALALKTAELARGVSVVAPDGYCLDQASLSKTFALLARCEAFGILTSEEDAPRAVITVTAPRATGSKLPEAEALVSESEALLDSYAEEDLQLVQVAGKAPAEGLSGKYWRGAGMVGRNMIGLAIYPAAGGPDLKDDAVRLLRETHTRSVRQSQPKTPAPKSEEETSATPKKEGKGLFARLFQ